MASGPREVFSEAGNLRFDLPGTERSVHEWNVVNMETGVLLGLTKPVMCITILLQQNTDKRSS